MSDPEFTACNKAVNIHIQARRHQEAGTWALAGALHRIAAALERLSDQSTQTPGAEPREGGEGT